MLPLLIALGALSSIPDKLPRGVIFHQSPAAIADIKTIAGRWVDKSGVPVMEIRPIKPGWAMLKNLRNDWTLSSQDRDYAVAVTVYEGTLLLSTPLRYSIGPNPDIDLTYLGRDCYDTVAIRQRSEGLIDLLSFGDKMAAANPWFPKPSMAPGGKKFSCGFIERIAIAAEHRHVIVTLEPPKSSDEGPYRRVRP